MRTRRALACLAVAPLLAACAQDAEIVSFHQSITQGTPDDREQFPGVCAFVASTLNPMTGTEITISGCAATLIAPTVLVTAAHCQGVFGWKPRVNCGAHLAIPASLSTDPATLPGAFELHPDYVVGSAVGSDPNDIAVFILEQPLTRIPFARLPPEGMLALDLVAPAGVPVTIVGYGLTGMQPSPPYPDPYTQAAMYAAFSPKDRNVGNGRLTDVTPDYLLLSADPSRICSLDSGGPVFVGSGTSAMILGVAQYCDDACASYSQHVRLDTPSARAFLRDVLEREEQASALQHRRGAAWHRGL